MSSDHRIETTPPPQTPLRIGEPDLGDGDLLSFALNFAGHRLVAPTVRHLLAEFGDVEIILASDPQDLRDRGGLSNRAVAILKLLHAFRTDNRRGQLLH